ncbi:thiamine-triphosphatase-like isoform X2 [Amphiura filiformis]|uniref:thiamine-triphosphatase-like isoform X2 n=1 Tax=Amphiura filiformis TaxID=82378 RepID=UPI003B217B7A
MATDSNQHKDSMEHGGVEKKIEIERKFAVTSDAGERILQAGGIRIKETTFEDAYFDTKSYQFTLADCWLRKRDGTWELKVGVHEDKLGATCTKYVEIEVESEIVSRLDAILNAMHNPEVNTKQQLSTPASSSSVEEYLQQHDMQNFATFKTTRTCYQIGEDVSVILDTTDFDFNVGEIEIMASESKVEETVQRLEKLSQELGFTTVLKGKLDSYLQRFRPQHYTALVNAKLLHP